MSLQKRKFYQVDAFASRPFEGNQACVVPLEDWGLSDQILQSVAAENNVSETAYIVQTSSNVFDLRWFTPTTEVRLCGHATLAAAHVLFAHQGLKVDKIHFDTRDAGRLTVVTNDIGYEMDFPVSKVEKIPITDELVVALGKRPQSLWQGDYLGAVFGDANDVLTLDPDFGALSKLVGGSSNDGCIGCLAFGGEQGADVVSRFFAPGAGINEDPATGSWHCMVAPIGKVLLSCEKLKCFQAYPGRGAWIKTKLDSERVKISGQAVTVIEGDIYIPQS